MTGSRLMHWIFCCLVAAASVAGCTSDTSSGEPSGSLNLNLELAEGIVINEVDWTLSGNGMAPMSGTIDTSAPGATASVEVFGLAPGENYLVELEATSEDGEVTCRGSAEFDVQVGVATDVMVFLNCKRPARLGGVRVNGKFNICADLAKVVVSPLQTSVGNQIDLAAQGTDPEGDAITYVWSATGGSIADSSAASTTYTCGEVGEQTITITISDDAFEYCMDDWTVAVTCVAGADLCEDVTCDDTGNECTTAECNPATGACDESNVEDGTDCGDGGTCSNGECVAVDLCEGVDCDDENDCTDDACDPADGSCSNTAVDNGAACNDDAGMCVDGTCVETDLCEGVTCDDTGNECTVAVCNMQNGECEEMNAPDGTECNGGDGACSAGVCLDNNLCDGVDCTSANDCVQDGACDPASGECIPGSNEPLDTSCAEGVCDGQGACVECNNAGQCPDDGNECTAAACDSNTCSTGNVADGTSCDGGDGQCMSGVCEAAMLCEGVDCGDGNECTNDVCDPADGSCSNPAVTDGTSCEGGAGQCVSGACEPIDLCEGVDCNDDNECTSDSCNGGDGSCTNAPVTNGTSCDGGAGQCMNGTCEANAVDPDPVTKPITLGCTNNITPDTSILPWVLTADPGPIAPSSALTVDYTGDAVFSETFLDAGLSAVPGLKAAELIAGVATVVARTGLVGSPVAVNAAPIQKTCSPISFNAGDPCNTAADCPPVRTLHGLRPVRRHPHRSTVRVTHALHVTRSTQPRPLNARRTATASLRVASAFRWTTSAETTRLPLPGRSCSAGTIRTPVRPSTPTAPTRSPRPSLAPQRRRTGFA